MYAIRSYYGKTLGSTTSDYPATKVWSYGPAADPIPATAAPDPASQFNYPAYTVETISAAPVSVRWRNELVAINPATGFPYPEGSAQRTFLPHILTNAVDQTLHWANPPQDCRMNPLDRRTDCMGTSEVPYTRITSYNVCYTKLLRLAVGSSEVARRIYPYKKTKETIKL